MRRTALAGRGPRPALNTRSLAPNTTGRHRCTPFMCSSRPGSMDAEAEHTFLFADIVGFTAFTETVGDDVAADVAVAFKSAAAHAADELGCEVVKDLGDAVMIHGRDAARVLMLALRLARELADEGWCPP